MKSPCLTCDLYAQSKDNPVCKECEERIRYVNAIDGIQLPDSALKVRKRASMGKLKKGEIYIQSVCDQYHIELSDLKSRKFGGNLREIRKGGFDLSLLFFGCLAVWLLDFWAI